MRKNEEITKISIKEFLEGIGVSTRKEGHRYFASSPFASDRNWSFCIYPTNTYFDFSTGHGGNIINLVSRLYGISTGEAAKRLAEGIKNETYKPNYKAYKEPERYPGPFNLKKYINTSEEECERIKAYAASRKIAEGFECGVFFTRQYSEDGSHFLGWVRVPALAFVHVDQNLQPCGIKFRKLVTSSPKDPSPRFSARGRLHHYLLLPSNSLAQETQSQTILGEISKNVLYVVEGEANANSLWEYLGRTCSVLSAGGVSSALTREELPTILSITPTSKIKLLIDYDGNEKLYQERLKLYEGLHADPIRMILPKGEDINSLYNQNKMWMIEHLLIN